MFHLVNQASYVFVALPALTVAVSVATVLHGPVILRAGLVLAVAAALLAFPLALRTGSGGAASTAEAEALIGGGAPVLLEFYPDF